MKRKRKRPKAAQSGVSTAAIYEHRFIISNTKDKVFTLQLNPQLGIFLQSTFIFFSITQPTNWYLTWRVKLPSRAPALCQMHIERQKVLQFQVAIGKGLVFAHLVWSPQSSIEFRVKTMNFENCIFSIFNIALGKTHVAVYLAPPSWKKSNNSTIVHSVELSKVLFD